MDLLVGGAHPQRPEGVQEGCIFEYQFKFGGIMRGNQYSIINIMMYFRFHTHTCGSDSLSHTLSSHFYNLQTNSWFFYWQQLGSTPRNLTRSILAINPEIYYHLLLFQLQKENSISFSSTQQKKFRGQDLLQSFSHNECPKIFRLAVKRSPPDTRLLT